ncbi:bifunctional phosphopantothenoylcysteine decarboxylase/phosphopantothenate--cysteine ligase CoaBC [Stenotrophobium rhamnosiphilum]|uniref:Coenzyme A biosynthesis bifunctional protein CoaBC n=1 Tax=Stenotrophobium rhamnosiphilum TaxID=2029166 RepID=A0A2T5MGM3_9GAMM|nr:bifunctional phosphopantothenoylcysteine decarboxylase/phosphopantothenate--cysteine ligase CoaBC [Stenotrophobium rhamnosiphilum]PTU31679.1 bifunctional phosphopantothenoylcysteine decarboxylase/phosphopantothenate--cysteine ligase CoaBC [Stenotrophobium rhamnosiphilum]
MQTSLTTLAGRRILLGVTGGIAAYKAADLTRRFKEVGADVQVVMTAGATEFVAPLTFQALSGREVRSALFDAAHEAAMGHIELARWADVIVIAPASANFIAQIAQGSASDLLTTLCLATDRPLAIAPAMNRLMWSNAATQANVATLRQRGVHIFGPGAGSQACGEVGDGRMLEPTEIRTAVAHMFEQGPLAGVRAVVTAGPTREPIDPVRVITNRSSGKQGYAVAQALSALGASVTLVSGPTALATPPGVQRVDIETAQDMLQASLTAAAQSDIFVGTAAVADYRPAQAEMQKIKKKDAEMSLPLERTTDVLKAVREKYPVLFMVGFAAETEKLAEHAQGKLQNKKLDLIAANLVGNGRAFDREDNALHLFWPGGDQELAPASKTALARELAQVIASRYRSKVGI